MAVPDIALCGEKRVRLFAHDGGGPPLEQLVERAEGQADTDHEKEEPLAALERRETEQDLAREDGGDEALRNVAEPIVVVAREVEKILQPEAQRNALVGVVTAENEDECV